MKATFGYTLLYNTFLHLAAIFAFPYLKSLSVILISYLATQGYINYVNLKILRDESLITNIKST